MEYHPLIYILGSGGGEIIWFVQAREGGTTRKRWGHGSITCGPDLGPLDQCAWMAASWHLHQGMMCSHSPCHHSEQQSRYMVFPPASPEKPWWSLQGEQVTL